MELASTPPSLSTRYIYSPHSICPAHTTANYADCVVNAVEVCSVEAFLHLQDATGNAADIAVGWAIGCGAPFAFGETHHISFWQPLILTGNRLLIHKFPLQP